MKKVFNLVASIGILATSCCCQAFVPAEPQSNNFSQQCRFMSSSGMQHYINWSPLSPATFENGITLDDGSQIAKDEDYLNAILKEWNNEEREFEVESKPMEYLDDQKGNLFGRLVRRKTKQKDAGGDDDEDNNTAELVESSSLPGILLFHTGAGPLDVSLFYKADCLVQKFDCVVLICDIISDVYGWAWQKDRTQYGQVRNELLKDDGTLMRDRAASGANALCCVPEVNPHKLAAMGWCLGGQPILELGRVQSAAFSIQAMATFHGVFYRDEPLTTLLTDESSSSDDASTDGDDSDNCSSINSNKKILICHGSEDPFESSDHLQDTQNFFESSGWTVDLQQYEGAKHGFSNPAQDFNDDPAFGYHKDAATESWKAALDLLEQELF